MTTKIKTRVDKFGRFVIPKSIRQDLGIKNNSTVFIEARENEIIVRPDESIPFVKDMDGIIVVCSEMTEEFTGFLKQDRENRIKRIAKDINP